MNRLPMADMVGSSTSNIIPAAVRHDRWAGHRLAKIG